MESYAKISFIAIFSLLFLILNHDFIINIDFTLMAVAVNQSINQSLFYSAPRSWPESWPT